VKEFDLVKSKIEARDNALHLDCCFQPIGPNKGLFIRADFEEGLYVSGYSFGKIIYFTSQGRKCIL
jgi:hypothetical protein